MSRFLASLITILGTIIFSSHVVQAEPVKYEFEKPHTQIVFFADHLGFSKSSGRFMDFDGHFVFDEQDPASSSVEVTIQTDSINMSHEKWEDHMKNADFFNVSEYPTMTFKSAGIEITGEKTANITGDLTILDVTKPVTLAVQYNRSGVHPFNKKFVAGFSATTMIDRSEWGMKYGLPMMSPEVEIRIEVEGLKMEDAE